MIKSLIKNNKEFIYYSLIGVSGTIVDLVTLYIFVEFLNIGVLVGATFSFILAATNNFIFNKNITFKDKYHGPHQYIKFILVSIVGLLLTVVSMFVLYSILRLWYIVAKLCASAIVLLWNYVGNKHWTFKKHTCPEFQKEKHDLELSVIVPCYNEERRILKSITRIKKYLDSKFGNYEIIIVDDKSTDNTVSLLKESEFGDIIKIIQLDKNYGKGYAIKKGVEESQGELIIFTDADLSTPIEEIEKLISFSSNYPIVIGSRKLRDSMISIKQPFYRTIISRLGYKISGLIIKDIKDTQCGFKLFHNQYAKFLFDKQIIKRFGFDLEILSVAQMYHIPIKEVAVEWSHAENSSFRLVKDSVFSFWEFLIIQYNLITKKY
jgi:dolichyl-phosphate beta-glucosyltransferase